MSAQNLRYVHRGITSHITSDYLMVFFLSAIPSASEEAMRVPKNRIFSASVFFKKS